MEKTSHGWQVVGIEAKWPYEARSSLLLVYPRRSLRSTPARVYTLWLRAGDRKHSYPAVWSQAHTQATKSHPSTPVRTSAPRRSSILPCTVFRVHRIVGAFGQKARFFCHFDYRTRYRFALKQNPTLCTHLLCATCLSSRRRSEGVFAVHLDEAYFCILLLAVLSVLFISRGGPPTSSSSKTP